MVEKRSPKKWIYMILIFYKLDFKSTLVTRNNASLFLLIMRIIHQEEISVTIQVPNTDVTSFIKYVLLDLNTQIGPKTRTVADFNSLFSPIDRSFSKKISETIYTNDQINLIDIYRVVQLTATQYKLFSAAHGKFS
jgi:hypothetical protein